jgi:hypothetical protein
VDWANLISGHRLTRKMVATDQTNSLVRFPTPMDILGSGTNGNAGSYEFVSCVISPKRTTPSSASALPPKLGPLLGLALPLLPPVYPGCQLQQLEVVNGRRIDIAG